MKNHLTFR